MPNLQPTLSTKNYQIRPSTPADHDALATFALGPKVWQQHNRKERATPQGFRAFFEDGLQLGTALTFERLSDGAVVGSCRYAALTKDGWEIGWTYLNPELWGTGANGEIKQALLEYAYQHVPNVVLHVHQDNYRSQGAVRKLGARVISHLHPLAPSGLDMIGFLLTREEWKRQQGVARLRSYLAEQSSPRLVFVCTHNSRRSHLAAVAAQHLGAETGADLMAYSAGTEATACHPNTVAALRRAGHQLRVAGSTDPDNPRYELYLAGADELDGAPALELWSKRIDDPSLPNEGFAAVMVCSDAEANCPYVPGAELRIALPFADPKRSDGTGLEEVVYDGAYREVLGTLRRVFKAAAAEWLIMRQP